MVVSGSIFSFLSYVFLGKENPKSYWEMLADKEDAYQLADELWNEIKPIYFKLQEFVKTRLFRFYNISTSDSEIPVYLLGTTIFCCWFFVSNLILKVRILAMIGVQWPR